VSDELESPALRLLRAGYLPTSLSVIRTNDHNEPHFSPSGLCQCSCQVCTTRPAKLCACADCPCDSRADHRADAPPR
jgi:hypothetical protein